ncbi:MAG: energy-coupling factor ABC transporter permease, partial [Nitrospiraceae bacterium]
MSDALLSPSVGTAFWAATLGAIGYASGKLKKNLDEKIVPLMGVLGAFIFAAQMINFTIPGTGSSGHLGGGMLLAIVLGPWAGFLVMASVLTVQALFFADGGLLALGCNIWNLGIYPCFIGLPLIYRPLTSHNQSNGRIILASLLSAVIGLQAGSFSVVLQTLLSGKSELPFATFLALMQPIHLAIGLVEGVVTAGVISYVRHAKPEMLEGIPHSRPLASGSSLKRLLWVLVIVAAVTGGVVSWFASTFPDGLEWSVEKVYGKSKIPEQDQGIAALLKGLQEKTAVLPDYTFKDKDEHQKGEE